MNVYRIGWYDGQYNIEKYMLVERGIDTCIVNRGNGDIHVKSGELFNSVAEAFRAKEDEIDFKLRIHQKRRDALVSLIGRYWRGECNAKL